MRLTKIKEILDAKVMTCENNLDREVKFAFGSDLMSDVLTFVKDNTILLTGLTNNQVIRTAELLDVFVIIFVRGKVPSEDILKMAKSKNITLMTTDYILYSACGRLYERGLMGLDIKGAMTDE